MESTYLLVGQSAFLINEQIKTYQDKFKLDQFNIVKLDALETEIEVINQELQTVSFFSDLKMVVIEHLDGLTRYDDKVLSTFYKYLESPSSDIVLILTITELPKDHNLGSYLEKYTFIETIQSLEGETLISYIRESFHKEGYQIEDKSIQLIIERTQNDLFSIHQEISKIKMYAYDEKIVFVEDVDLLVTRNLEDNIFSFSTAYLKGNIKSYMQIYDDLVTNKMPTITIFNHLFNTMHLIMQTKDLMEQGLNQKTLAEQLGVSSGRAYHLMKEAKLQSKKDLETLIHGLAKLDVEIKSGMKDEKLGFELLLLRRLA
ncbi:DNA polymerase III subunit delta [Acholeplasma laidlawii]|uniref:DNA polymerase III subunit delta n=1 Tax=Acholeplasma laidlawii TaxID=2148 RepID=A0A553IHN2_ACHLA|nr:DNA polymerase III subunit delta [Acholeplasma laidlawii]NWH09920.1 DNA polymerase III subunit delta [Acholeplasma laidlawii]NWH11310.1 DNA polymerase III subunit delta [Acholeplasma laidlawii]NWH13280.1 DNA polymerase III subunit delta [Acholeplasma laidlawii]NWH14172.1 DNA polymerase III subunit delta [Acholeplasma laidlawii]OAN20295.1 hypothetical protein A2I99_01180 [Acholeplasma laidlawii]